MSPYENPYMTRFVMFTRVSARTKLVISGVSSYKNPSTYDEPCDITERLFLAHPGFQGAMGIEQST